MNNKNELHHRAAVIVAEPAGLGRAAEMLHQTELHGIPGFETHLIPAAEIDALRDGGYDIVHLAAAELAAASTLRLAAALGLPVIADAQAAGRHAHLRDCTLVLSPSRARDRALLELGLERERIARWEPGIDRERFGPAHYSATALPHDSFNVLCTDPLDDDPAGRRLLQKAFDAAADRTPQLRLITADGVEDEVIPRLYASADLFVSVARDDGFGHTVLEAQTSGLPVLAIEGSGAGELIESGRSGCLIEPDADALGAAIRGLARRATLRERLITGALLAARERTWERSLLDLSNCWARARSASLAAVAPGATGVHAEAATEVTRAA